MVLACTCTLNPLQICRGTLGNVLNVSHTEERAQRRYPVHCSVPTRPPGHWQLRWGDHRLERSVWTDTVSLQIAQPTPPQPSSSFSGMPIFPWKLGSLYYALLLIFMWAIHLRVRWIFILFICVCECVLRCWWCFLIIYSSWPHKRAEPDFSKDPGICSRTVICCLPVNFRL